MPQLPVDTRYLQSPIFASRFMPHEILNFVESKRSYNCLLFLPNMKLKKSFLMEEMLFLVWIRREEKWNLIKLYKVRFC